VIARKVRITKTNQIIWVDYLILYLFVFKSRKTDIGSVENGVFRMLLILVLFHDWNCSLIHFNNFLHCCHPFTVNFIQYFFLFIWRIFAVRNFSMYCVCLLQCNWPDYAMTFLFTVEFIYLLVSPEWYWKCLFVPWSLRLLAAFLALMSLMVVWSECLFFIIQPVLSLFAQFLDIAKLHYNYIAIEVSLFLNLVVDVHETAWFCSDWLIDWLPYDCLVFCVEPNAIIHRFYRMH